MLRFICVLVTVVTLGFCAVVDIKNVRKLESESISEVVVGDVKTNKSSLAEQSPNDKFARPIIIEPVVAEEENLPEPEIVNKNDKFARPQFVKNGDVEIDPKSQPILDPRSHQIDVKPNKNITVVRPPNDKFVSEEYIQSIIANKTEEKPSDVKPEIILEGSKGSDEVKNSKGQESMEVKLPTKVEVFDLESIIKTEDKELNKNPVEVKNPEKSPNNSKLDNVNISQGRNVPKSQEVNNSPATVVPGKVPAVVDVQNSPVSSETQTVLTSTEVPNISSEKVSTPVIPPLILNKPPNPSVGENDSKVPNSPDVQNSSEKLSPQPSEPSEVNNSLKQLNSPEKQNITKVSNSGNVQKNTNEQNKPKPSNSPNKQVTSKPLKPSITNSTPKPSTPSNTPKPSIANSTPKPSTPKPTNLHTTPKPPTTQNLQTSPKPQNPSKQTTPKPSEVKSTPKPPTTEKPTTQIKIESNEQNQIKPIIAGVLPNDKFVTQEYIESIKNKVRQEITSEIIKSHEDSPIQAYVDSLTSNFNIKSANAEKPCENNCNDDVIYKPDDVKKFGGDEYVQFVSKKEPAKGRDVEDDDDGINLSFLKVEGANIPCSTTTGNTGTCLPLLLCKEMNGMNANNVHNNNGGCGALACCEISKGCSETISTKVGYFKNPRVVGPSCRLSIKAFNQNVCQIRLDFDEFQLANPSQQTGAINSPISCRDDSMVIVTPNGLTIPILCGSMKGQHMYIPINTTDGEMAVQLVMNLGPRPGLPTPKWKIKVTQLECPVNPDVVTSAPVMKDDFVALAPYGCLQYFTEPQGTICNFGYDPDTPNPFYIANHKYAICFKRRPNNCGIRFTAKNFQMSGRPNDCAGDYLFIPGAEMRSSGNTNIRSSYCEKMITPESEVISMLPGPFNIQFITDNVGSIEERGWCLNYRTFSTGNCL